MESIQMDRLIRRSWALAVVSSFLFALGAVATWGQEFVVGLSHRVASLLMLAGLLLSVGSLALAARLLFSGAALARSQNRSLLGTLFLAALPPVAFLSWLVFTI
jgi:hypothetical protein